MSADTTKGTHVDMIARILVGSDWDEEVPYTDIGSRQYVEDVSGRISTAMASAYYRQAAASIRALAHKGMHPQRYMAFVDAANLLDSTARDLEGDTE